jgi:hypothetical protein
LAEGREGRFVYAWLIQLVTADIEDAVEAGTEVFKRDLR